jgi:hypothetical protein
MILGLSLPVAALAQGGSAAPYADSPAAAQAAPPAAVEGNAARRHGHRCDTPEQAAQRIEQHLARLRSDLHITPAQQPQWDAFTKVTRENTAELHQRFQQHGTRLAGMSATDNMADYTEISKLHAQELLKLATAFRAPYATMSGDQRKNADAMFRLGHQRAGGMRH